ncbi:hypothetical protein N2K99_09130 [Arthrobacter sp. zg-Y1110]|nr:GIY-YIG nuclease family protein [Arthrobacter sp. zg-Y1110]UWX83681.1 hypothetical protein N2K99_09130 [Arthrobacter sp. zg-Y1110]
MGEGSPTSPGGIKAYIGEGDDISRRPYDHTRSKDKEFWNRAILLTSKDANLAKAHARYLEARFIAVGHQAARSEIANGTASLPPALPESDVSDKEYFIAQALIALPVLGINIFRAAATIPTEAATMSASTKTAEFELRLSNTGNVARALEVDGEFTVRAGSPARGSWVSATNAVGYRTLREDLEREGSISVRDVSAKEVRYSLGIRFSQARALLPQLSWVDPPTVVRTGLRQRPSCPTANGRTASWSPRCIGIGFRMEAVITGHTAKATKVAITFRFYGPPRADSNAETMRSRCSGRNGGAAAAILCAQLFRSSQVAATGTGATAASRSVLVT